MYYNEKIGGYHKKNVHKIQSNVELEPGPRDADYLWTITMLQFAYLQIADDRLLKALN